MNLKVGVLLKISFLDVLIILIKTAAVINRVGDQFQLDQIPDLKVTIQFNAWWNQWQWCV